MSVIKKIKKWYYKTINNVFGYKAPGKVRQLRAELIEDE